MRSAYLHAFLKAAAELCDAEAAQEATPSVQTWTTLANAQRSLLYARHAWNRERRQGLQGDLLPPGLETWNEETGRVEPALGRCADPAGFALRPTRNARHDSAAAK